MEIYVNNNKIEQVCNINFLGINIDKDLNFKEHINKLVKKLRQLSSYCYKIRDKLDDKGKKMFYYTMIYSSITYGIEVYSNTYWTNLKLLDNTHKKIIKILFKLPRVTPTNEVYMKNELLDLRHIIMLQLVKIGHKWAHNELPDKLQNLFKNQAENNKDVNNLTKWTKK